ncbi:coronin-1C-A-like isoform X2 [Liolophura sinensis]|uniref:coronin-1C-A-like isoform X2 n=1 Tax=Liolophura sinensis TaxID=3198878 RepID=UPI003159045B
MSKFMRQSKYRHVFGQALKRDQCFDGIRVTKIGWESTYCSVNPKYVAVIVEAAGGGAFLVLNINKPGRIDMNAPKVAGHTQAVLDIAWSPFNDDIIASSSEDCHVKIWEIPEGGLVTNLEEPVADLFGHERKVGIVTWHPTAENVLLSGGFDNRVIVWDVGEEEPLVEVNLADVILSASWSYDGSRFVTSTKDKKFRVIDARKGEVIQEGDGHKGSKPSQVHYLKNGQIFSTGFSRMSERQYALWSDEDLSKPLTMEEIDNSNGVMFPFYDADSSMVYLCGKGDSIIRFYEITDEAPYVHYLSLFQSNTPQRGIGWMPKRGLNVNNNEIARFFKLHNNGLCEIIPFTVPRKSELFQDDLYPDTRGDTPAMSAQEWFSGMNKEPEMISLKEGFKSKTKEKFQSHRKSNVKDRVQSKRFSSTTSANSQGDAKPAAAPPAAAAPALPPGFDPQAIVDDLRKLKLIVKAHERRIKTLEEKLGPL